MKNNQLKTYYGSLKIVFLLLFLSACSSTDSNISPTSSPRVTLTQEVKSPTVTISPTTPTTQLIHPPNPTPPPTLPPSPLLEIIKAEFLATDCSVPCMFDIIPGQTKANEIPTILGSLKEEGIIEDFYLNHHPSAIYYIASFSSYPLGFVIQIDENENIVLTVGFGTDNRVITLMEIVERFGEPVYVIPSVEPSYLSLFLGYPDENIFVEVRSDFISDKFATPEMTVKTLKYETPEVSDTHFLHPNAWASWEGYKSFEYYFMVHDQLKEQTLELDSIE